jgi:hypothetical protein
LFHEHFTACLAVKGQNIVKFAVTGIILQARQTGKLEVNNGFACSFT